MYHCPECKIPLKKNSSPFGIIWLCPTCSGKAISIYVLKKVISENIIRKLWQRANSGQYKAKRKCLDCDKSLHEVPIINDNKTINLDICTQCSFIWFDGQEYESLPKREITNPEENLSPEARDALVKFKVELIKKQYEQEYLCEIYDDLLLEMKATFIDAVLYLIFKDL